LCKLLIPELDKVPGKNIHSRNLILKLITVSQPAGSCD
jgi:hypothetical protein